MTKADAKRTKSKRMLLFPQVGDRVPQLSKSYKDNNCLGLTAIHPIVHALATVSEKFRAEFKVTSKSQRGYRYRW